MDFSYPQEAEQFRKELQAWLSAHLTDTVIAASARRGSDEDAFETLRAWNATIADAGWAAVSWPQQYGGRGASAIEQLVYAEEATRARVPHPLNTIGINNIAPAIMQYGSDEQKAALLSRMLRADDIWCQGMSEPEAGSDLASLRTKAVRDGDDFVVSGQKIWTSLGHRADWCQLYVRTDPEAPKHKGISCLIVDMSLPGIEARPLVTLSGDADFAEVFFNGVRIPVDALLGPLNKGWQVATTTLSHERAGAARLYAEMQLRLRDLVADLVADDSSAVDDPSTVRRLGELDTRIKNLEILCQRSISAGMHGGDAFATAGLAKSVWGEIGKDLAALAFDTLGPGAGDGRWDEFRLTSHALTIAGGTTQINKNITAQRVLGLPRS
ncbi:acyl-CoA dehydrogenase [Mycolicibacterium rhodesiae NBB3]|uniref:Acyl-CoA dehydrogenase n=1 Tax=Mycolicibacterium rhodesiae (strain NBB3) TaxID=710685 RepID=G8RP68_MYCRN|nr:acyl-CoA dehydrogenase family protein [Mycolicibacterium rhodesiae]AEV76297.1 acyl-CoA dehydrogenase [Mycolicibacterium rhodesiae NBB3]